MRTPLNWRITLVAKGVPFREAHHIVGEAVVEAIRQGKPLEELPLTELQKFSQGDWRRCLSDSVAAIVPRQACGKRRRLTAAGGAGNCFCAGAVGGKNIYMYKFEPWLIAGLFYGKKKRIPEIRKSSRWL